MRFCERIKLQHEFTQRARTSTVLQPRCFSLLTTEVKNDFYVSVIRMLLGQGDVGGRGTLGTGVGIGPQSVSGALQSCRSVRKPHNVCIHRLFDYVSVSQWLYESTSQQAGPSDQQLEVEFVRCQVGGRAGEDGVSAPLLRVMDSVGFS